jgi:hypothetical protein
MNQKNDFKAKNEDAIVLKVKADGQEEVLL